MGNVTVDINNVVNGFILKNDLSVEDYTFEAFFNYVIESNGIIVFDYPFKRLQNCDLSGLLVKDKSGISISYNSLDVPVRQNFSKCHELIHFMRHIDKADKYRAFQDMSFEYEESSLNIEIEANIGASIILLPDVVLIHKLKENISFQTMANHLKMSKPALFNRLIHFLTDRAQMRAEYAKKIVCDYANYGNKEVIKRYLFGFNSTVEKQILLDFENSI